MKRIAAVLIFAAGFGFIAFASLSKRSNTKSSKEVTEKKTDKESKKECKKRCMYSDI